MTIKLFIAFLIFYLHTAIRTINVLFPAPHPLFPRISLLQFLPANRTSVTLGDRGDERGCGRLLTLHLLANSAPSLCSVPLCELYSGSTRVLLDNYRIQAGIFFQPVSISK